MKKEKITDSHYLILLIASLLAISAVFIRIKPFTPEKSSVVLDTTKPAINESNLIKIPDTMALFNTKIFLERDNTKVVVPFKFQTDSYMLTLSLKMASGEPISKIIFHPVLEELNWEKLDNEDFTLYQKDSDYKSIETFLTNPPGDKNIVADPFLIAQYPQLNANPLGDSLNADAADYIFTTYRSPRLLDSGLYETERYFDATDALVDAEDQLNWVITAPLASPENPYYLGMIHVDYD